MIVKRGGKYGVSVYDPHALSKKRWIGTFDDEEAAAAAEERATAGERFVGGYAHTWLNKHPRRSDETNREYSARIRAFTSRFGSIAFEALSSGDLTEWAKSQAYGARTVARLFINDAIRDGFYPGPNPLASTPRRTRLRHTVRLCEADVIALGECAIDVWGGFGAQVFAPMILVAAFQRLFPAELFGLKWAAGGGIVTGDRAGEQQTIRRSELEPRVARALALIPTRTEGELVFRTQSGRPFNTTNLFYYWVPVRASFGHPELAFLNLRYARVERRPER